MKLKIVCAMLAILAISAPVAAQTLDARIFQALTGGEWVTRDAKGVVNYVTFRGIDAEDRVGIAVRTFTEFSEFGDRVSRSIPMMFWVEDGLVVISGNNYFVLGSGGWLWRIDRDTQTVEPIE